MSKAVGLLVFILVLSIYSLTTSPYLQAGDSAEMATVGITLGVPHQPNYPLYTLLTHYFTKLPIPYIGNFVPKNSYIHTSIYRPEYINIYRTGLFSALVQAGAVYFFYRICLELIKRHGTYSRSSVFIAVLASLIYATSGTIWLYSTKPEVFALNNFFVSLIIYLLLNFWFDPSQKKFPKKIFLLLGLAVGHHQTAILILPVIGLVYLYKQQAETGKKPVDIVSSWLFSSFDKKFNAAFPYIFLGSVGLLPFFIILWVVSQRYPFVNWGEISNWFDLVRALVRSDYGIIGAYLTNTPQTMIALNQIPFFADHLLSDLSLYVIVAALIGYIVIYRQDSQLQKILAIGFLITGPLFLMYANFSLDSDFSKATVVRFYMLPTLFIVMAGFIGFNSINDKIRQAVAGGDENKDALVIGHGLYLILILGITFGVLIKNIPYYDNLTYHYARSMVVNLEDNAIVMITGDIPTMTMQYMQAVEGQKKNRIIFSPGQFHLKWFQKQLRKRYPHLKIPDPEKGKLYTSATQVVDANIETHPIYVSPEFIEIDPQLQNRYLLWPKGLLLKVEKPGTNYKLEDYLKENADLYNSIDVREFAKLRSKSYQLESPLITFYARHFFNVGSILKSVHRYEDSIIQFERSLNIDPNFSENYKALGNLYYLTPDFPKRDPQQAAQFYHTYLNTAQEISVEDYNSVASAIQKINQEVIEQQQIEQKSEQQQLSTNDATSSASPTAEVENK